MEGKRVSTPQLSDAHKQMIIHASVAVLLTVLSIWLGVSYPEPPAEPPPTQPTAALPPLDLAPGRSSAGVGITHFTAVSAEDITASDDLTVGGDLSVAGLELAATTAVTLTPDAIITPTTNVVLLSATADVTMTLGGACSDGQVVYLVGDDAQTITVQDSNIRTHDGAALTITQYDVAALVCNRNNWYQLAEVANS